ncbi:MAG: DUF6851 domain-containing protein [Bacteroidota bacterium]
MKKTIALTYIFLFCCVAVQAQHSVARLWNEATLNGIRGDLARPTVHARNLFHTSIAMYDAWAAYSDEADTYLLGKTVHGFTCGFNEPPLHSDIKSAREETLSFAVYRILQHRFEFSPGQQNLYAATDYLMDSLGYDRHNRSTNYICGPAELGNYIADQIIQYGLQDGSNEALGYTNLFYEPINPPMMVEVPGNRNIVDLNRWQPLGFAEFIDQSGNPLGNATPAFVSPEWGQVLPFSLNRDDAQILQRNGDDYWVYQDPGPPPYLDTTMVGGLSEEYKWGFAMVGIWSSLLDPADGVMIDISPASIGNITEYPTDLAGYHDFYNVFEGGDTGNGYALNPRTGLPYEPQIVHRADYARVLAEFWADGPDSETPPGHWFTIFNYICDHPQMEYKMRGQGPVLDDLEWDVKGYFALGGAMHDVAISVWGLKGWYDYVRPVSAIRGMAELGQSSDPAKPNFHPGGLPLIPGYIELIEAGDSLVGPNNLFLNEIKIKGWRGPDFIIFPTTDVAGVGWVRANYWWPYQRPTFVSPPFAGYVSGHSTFSRAAAEVLTAMTGDPYFPGGMGEFFCEKNEFLVFEDGPSTDLTLQWATYRDASDQCSLSRIYGGIHPPADDIPGRFIGKEIGENAFAFAETYFNKEQEPYEVEAFRAFPNPTDCSVQIELDFEGSLPIQVVHSDGRIMLSQNLNFINKKALIDLAGFPNGVYTIVGWEGKKERKFETKVVFQNNN